MSHKQLKLELNPQQQEEVARLISRCTFAIAPLLEELWNTEDLAVAIAAYGAIGKTLIHSLEDQANTCEGSAFQCFTFATINSNFRPIFEIGTEGEPKYDS